jgi:hypothetical protein
MYQALMPGVRSMRCAALLLVAGLLAGCVDQIAQRETFLNRFVGQPESALVQQMGVPNRTYETGGVKYLAYDQHRVEIVPSFPSYSPFFTGWYGGGFPPQVLDLQCETTFAVSGGTVTSFTIRGNACG